MLRVGQGIPSEEDFLGALLSGTSQVTEQPMIRETTLTNAPDVLEDWSESNFCMDEDRAIVPKRNYIEIPRVDVVTPEVLRPIFEDEVQRHRAQIHVSCKESATLQAFLASNTSMRVILESSGDDLETIARDHILTRMKHSLATTWGLANQRFITRAMNANKRFENFWAKSPDSIDVVAHLARQPHRLIVVSTKTGTSWANAGEWKNQDLQFKKIIGQPDQETGLPVDVFTVVLQTNGCEPPVWNKFPNTKLILSGRDSWFLATNSHEFYDEIPTLITASDPAFELKTREVMRWAIQQLTCALKEAFGNIDGQLDLQKLHTAAVGKPCQRDPVADFTGGA